MMVRRSDIDISVLDGCSVLRVNGIQSEERFKMLGISPALSGATWITARIAARRFEGRLAAILINASTPPAEAPIAIMSGKSTTSTPELDSSSKIKMPG